MANLDQTGLQGQGPQTGRGTGRCGHVRGMGNGCCGRRFYTHSEEKELLEEDIKNLEADLKAAKERLLEVSQ